MDSYFGKMNTQICCPVCTLYLREGITLQSHLDTHPKDQVINALVKFALGNSSQLESTSPENVSPTENPTKPNIHDNTLSCVSSEELNNSNIANENEEISNQETTSLLPNEKSSPNNFEENIFKENATSSPKGNQNNNILNENQPESLCRNSNSEQITSTNIYQNLKVEQFSCQNRPISSDTIHSEEQPDIYDENSINSEKSNISNTETSLNHIEHLKCTENISFIDITNNNSNLSLQDDQNIDNELNDLQQKNKYIKQTKSMANTKNDFKNALKSHGIINYNQNSQERSKAIASPIDNFLPSSNNLKSNTLIIDEVEDANIDPLDTSKNIPSVSYNRFNELNLSQNNNDEYMCMDVVFEQIKKNNNNTTEVTSNHSFAIVENNKSNDLIANSLESNPVIENPFSDKKSNGTNEGETSYKTFSFMKELNIDKNNQEDGEVNLEIVPKNSTNSEIITNHGNWLQNFQTEREDISVSFDLMARESWGSSDLSDNEATIRIPTLSQNNITTINDSLLREKILAKQNYKCNLCNEIFDCPKERRVHKSTHHKNLKEETEEQSKLPNSHFEEVFVKIDNESKLISENGNVPEDKTTLLMVKNAVSTELNQIHVCYMCGLKFSCKKMLIAHSKEAHEGSKFKCLICLEQFMNELEYNNHLKIHPLECTLCGKLFYKRTNLRNHVRRHLGIKPFKCLYCDKTFATRQKVSEHTNTHTGNSPLKCTECGETFKRYSNLIQHRKSKHTIEKKSIKEYLCQCGEIFHTKKRLDWHKETHNMKPRFCMYCSERFIHSASLTRHIRRAHDKKYLPENRESEENVECSICYCIFIKSSLKSHMKLHEGVKPYSCNICEKVFSTKWNLQDHQWTHASRSAKPFKCTQCNSAFHRLADYKSHIHSHKNLRPYTCNYCGSKFIRKYNCLRHVREHESEKSFACTMCPKTFHRRYYLNEHMNIHNGIRPFTCHICGKASSTRSNHNKHIKIHHAREPINTEG